MVRVAIIFYHENILFVSPKSHHPHHRYEPSKFSGPNIYLELFFECRILGGSPSMFWVDSHLG